MFPEQAEFFLWHSIHVKDKFYLNFSSKKVGYQKLILSVFISKFRCQARFGRDTFGRPFLVGPNLVQHIWSGPYLVQPIFGPNPYLVGAIFGPTKFGRCHIWSNQIWSVPYLVHPNLVSIYLVCTKYKLSNQHLLST